MKIISIKEEDFTYDQKHCDGTYKQSMSGFVITLDDNSQVRLGISNEQNCCEHWGYLMSEDNLDDYIGAELLYVEAVDEQLGTYDVPEVYEGSVMFINIKTSKGKFQFVAYNEHNGYYGHDAVVIQNNVIVHEERL